MKLESLLQYLDEYLEVEDFPDYGFAHNGLQVEGPAEVAHVAVAVDASEAVILRNLSTTMGHSTGLIREQCPVW